jgi:hypothetical protein
MVPEVVHSKSKATQLLRGLFIALSNWFSFSKLGKIPPLSPLSPLLIILTKGA